VNKPKKLKVKTEAEQDYLHDCATLSPSKLARKYPLTATSHRSRKSYAKKVGIPFDPKLDKFPNFLRIKGPRPSAEHTLDRIDHGRGYTVENTRWATKAQQVENRSITIRVSYRDKMLTAWEFAQLLGVSVDSVYRGLRRGESPEQIAFHAREASARKTVPEPWPWPADDQENWERSYKAHARNGESRVSFLRRVCAERYTALMRMMIRPAGNVEPEVVGHDDETGQPIHKSDPLPPGFHEHLERVKRMLADAELKYAAAARRTTDPFAELFRS
jgi:hypothetical protein